MLSSAYTLDLPLSDAQRLTFEACFKAHRHRVYRLGLRYGRGQESWAEDLTQDVFMRLFELLPTLNAQDDLGAWIYRVATNAALTRLRREKSLMTRLQKLWSTDEVETQSAADTRLLLSEDAKAAQSMLNALPPKEKVVLSMKVLDGLPQREIAVTLGMSEGYVSKLLARAWEKVHAAGWANEAGGGSHARS